MDHLKPLHKSRAVPIFQNIKGLSLTLTADELISKDAEVLSEGSITSETDDSSTYHGSTLVTINLDRRDLDLGPAREHLHLLAEAVSSSVLFRVRLMRLARLEAERRCAPYLLRKMSTQTEFKIEDRKLLVDIYIECPLAVPAARENSPMKGEV
ncbi:MAG: hypothetical protein GY847_24315 [Proteobacteria bacterium]|nr:hypothetical protein [Pseudomonadota bacterium]